MTFVTGSGIEITQSSKLLLDRAIKYYEIIKK